MTNFLENWTSADSTDHQKHPATPETGLNFVGIATDLAKTGSTFIPGKIGIAASAVVYGVAEIDRKASFTTQVAEAVTGAMKGVVMHKFVHRLPVVQPALKGSLLGLVNRADETVLSYHTYFDKDNKFSASQTAENFKQLADPKALVTDLAIGGLAYGAARTVTPFLSESISKSPLARNMVTGGLAGMTAGGANELVRESNSADGIQPWELAKHTFIAGAVGSIGAASGFYAGRVNFKSDSSVANFAPTAANSSERLRLTDATKPSPATAEAAVTDKAFAQLPGDFRYTAALSTTPPIFMREQLSLPKVIGDLTQPGESQHEFAAKNIIHEDRPVRVYDLPNGKDGVHQIVVPEEYAAKLDEIRNLHIAATSSDATTAAAARQSLSQNPLRNRTLPEHAQFALQRLPDGGENTRITLFDEANPMDAWYRVQHKNPSFVSAAATDTHGNVSLFKSEWGSRVTDNINHEWAHDLVERQQSFAQLHQTAVRFENGAVSDSYAQKAGERLPVHVEDLLSLDGDYAVIAGRERPIETSILARGLAKTTEGTSTQGNINNELRDRLNGIRVTFEPEARAKLAQGLNSDDATVRADAAKLLLNLDGHAELAKMQKPVSLSFSGETLSSQQMRTLGAMPIENLDLSNANLPRWSTSDWRLMPETKSLNVQSATNFGNFEVATVTSAMPNLERLNISRTTVGDTSIEELSDGKNLKTLDVSNTKITASGRKTLQQLLPNTYIVND